jgi:hypothetical protein
VIALFERAGWRRLGTVFTVMADATSVNVDVCAPNASAMADLSL